MRREDQRLWTNQEVVRVGQAIADQAILEKIMALVILAGTITGKPVKVYPDSPLHGQYTIEAGFHEFTYPGELERIKAALEKAGIELSFKDVVIQ